MKWWRGFREALTFEGAAKKRGRFTKKEDVSPVKSPVLVEDQGEIIFLGPEASLKQNKALFEQLRKIHPTECKDQLLMPSFKECHTHLIFAGDRNDEFERRNQGESYQSIAKSGGGIRKTMQATRAASSEALSALAQERIERFYKQGVSHLEVKSGYALNLKDELRLLKIIQDLSTLVEPRLISTFLGAHAVPPEFSSTDEYLKYLAYDVMPEVIKSGLSHRVDAFAEQGYFHGPALRTYLEQAKRLGFDLCLHAEQLSHSGGARLALELGAKSADHLVECSDQDIELFAKSETTAVFLPSADFYLKIAFPRARAFLDQGARVALATDFNPGSSPSQDLSFVGVLARREMKMTIEEVLVAYTYSAAAALGYEGRAGFLGEGQEAHFVVLKPGAAAEDLFYSVGYHPVDFCHVADLAE